jgi:hypothetical protein
MEEAAKAGADEAADQSADETTDRAALSSSHSQLWWMICERIRMDDAPTAAAAATATRFTSSTARARARTCSSSGILRRMRRLFFLWHG